MQKKMITGIIAILIVVTAVLVFVNRKGDKNVSGLVLAGGGKEVTIAWEDVDTRAPSFRLSLRQATSKSQRVP